MSDFEIEVPPSFEHLAMVRARLSTELGEANAVLKQERLHDLRLIVSEATTNAIEAHNAIDRGDSVRIRGRVLGDRVEVVIVDRGRGFKPDDLTPHPPVTDPERLEYERGLGVTLMRTLADECRIDSGSRGTTVTLVMYR